MSVDSRAAQQNLLPEVDILWESYELADSVHLCYLILVATGSSLAFEEGLAVLVKSQSGDNDVGGVDGDLDLLTVHLILG